MRKEATPTPPEQPAPGINVLETVGVGAQPLTATADAPSSESTTSDVSNLPPSKQQQTQTNDNNTDDGNAKK